MKKGIFLNKAFAFCLVTLLFLMINAVAQESKTDKKEQKAAVISGLVQSKNFVFVAQYANPLGGRTISLTSVYDVKLSNDTIVSELPYFGRAYVAPINPSEGGISFTSTRFTYTVSQKKKGGWDIAILPKDTRDVRQIFLSVSEAGYASLEVTSNNRQAISFNGYIIGKNKFK